MPEQLQVFAISQKVYSKDKISGASEKCHSPKTNEQGDLNYYTRQGKPRYDKTAFSFLWHVVEEELEGEN